MQMNRQRFNSGLSDEDDGFKFESKKGEKDMEYIGIVDAKGILFVYEDSEALRNQIQKGIVEEKFLFFKKSG